MEARSGWAVLQKMRCLPIREEKTRSDRSNGPGKKFMIGGVTGGGKKGYRSSFLSFAAKTGNGCEVTLDQRHKWRGRGEDLVD